MTVTLSDHTAAQRPTNSHLPSGPESQRLNDASDAAESIIAQLTGDAQKTADRCLRAWKLARKQGRLAILETPPGATVSFRGLTTPDTPSPPNRNGTPAPPRRGRYWKSQSRWQWTCIEAHFLASECACAVAVVILHEGWRLEQEVPTAPVGAPPNTSFFHTIQEITVNAQRLSVQDLENTKPAKALAACQDPAYLAELNDMEAEARAVLRAANQNAARLTRDGYVTPQAPAPY